MSSIDAEGNRRHKPGVKNLKKQKPKIDMTPMVDLGFLLIGFFVMTAELSKPKSASLNMPKDGQPMPLRDSSALTVLLAGNTTGFITTGEAGKMQLRGIKFLKRIFLPSYFEMPFFNKSVNRS